MKKLSTLLLALLATTALWAADFEVDGIAYNILGGDSVEVTSKSDEYSGTITIPATVTYNSTTYHVTSIGDRAFIYCIFLSSINVDAANTHYASIDGVLFNYAKDTLIQYPAGNTRTEYTIPNSVTSIGHRAFFLCTSLSSITIPNSVTSIGWGAFESCHSLNSITIPNSVTSIGNGAFNRCRSLRSITIPNSVTSIGESAFSECISLSSITIPNSVTSIGVWAFGGCTSLNSINVDAANTHYSSVDGVLFNYAKDTLIQYPAGNSLIEYTISNSVTSIGNEAFAECISLSSITIPNSVTSIGEIAFGWCESLSSINVDAANTHYSSVDGVLFNYAKDTLIQYPAGNKRTTYTIPNSVTSIGGGAFAYCDSLSSITIPNSVTSIGNGAFFYCESLKSITIPNSVTSIGEGAFYSCDSLSTITCYATTPPTCGEYCFYDVDKSIPLYVPEGSIDAYKAADEWKDCTNIQAISTPTDIKNENENVNENANVK